MTITVDHPPAAPVAGEPQPRGNRALRLAAIAAGTGLGLLVGHAGSPFWLIARVVAVAALTAVLVAVLDRVTTPAGGRIAVATGIPALTIAVGFAPHWVKHGPFLIQIGAAMLALSALWLVIGGAVIATTEASRWRRAVVALLIVVAMGGAAYLVGIPVAVTNVPRPELGDDPSSVGLEYTDVTLRTGDGVELAAWYVESTNGAAVVLLHGAGSTRSDVLDHAAVLAGAGYGVVMIDARGHGDSGGRAMDFGWYGDADIAAATDYLATRPDVDTDRIGAVGMSMGGEQAIGASGSNPLIRAVVAEGATSRAAADDAWLSDRYGLRGAFQEQIEKVQDLVTDLLTGASVPTALRTAISESETTRYLLIAAGDVGTESQAAAHMAAAAPDRVTVWTIPGVGHTGGLVADPDLWTQRVIGFLDTALGS